MSHSLLASLGGSQSRTLIGLLVSGALSFAGTAPAQEGTPAPAQPSAPQPVAPGPSATAAPASPPPSPAPATPAPASSVPATPTSDNGPIVQQVQVSDHPPEPVNQEDVVEPTEPPVPPPPTPLPDQESASIAIGIGFNNSLTSIHDAFPWGFNVNLQGSLHIVGPLHTTLGLQLNGLQLKGAGTTGNYVCDYTCKQETESGMLVSLPLGVALHAPVGEHRVIFGAGGLYAWYSANTHLATGFRKGPGAYGRVTFSIHGWRSVYYDLFADTSVIWSSGEQFQARLAKESSSDVWLNLGFALRLGL